MAARTFDTCDAVHPAAGVLPIAPFARVEVFTNATPILEGWRDLEAQAPCSIYQTRAFVLPWLETMGRRATLAPFFVLARDHDERPAALLCLGLRRRGPFRVATWLGGKDANFNMPLLRRPNLWSAADLRRLLREASQACNGSGPDVFELANQPLSWDGFDNPFARLLSSESPSFAYGTALAEQAETLFAEKLSKDARKKLRKKEAKLASFGPVAHRVVHRLDEQEQVIDAFLTQKLARFRAQGIASDFDAPEMRTFLEKASPPSGSGIELHALYAGEQVVAVYGGAAHAGQWSGMFSSFDGDEEIARTSPGDLLLMRVMAACCTAGLRRFDLGIGEAAYKATFCDEAIPLLDVVVPTSLRGRAYAAFARLRLTAKRKIKRDPRLLGIFKRLRAARA